MLMFELIECSRLMLELLEKLKSENQISQEEYEMHAKLKREFISRFEKRTCEPIPVSLKNQPPDFRLYRVPSLDSTGNS